MSTILMNILAYLAILSIIGLIGIIVWMVSTAEGFVKTGKGAMQMLVPPRRAAEQIVNTGKGIALKSKARATTMYGHGKVAADHVLRVKEDVTAAASSIDIDDLKSTLKNTARVVGNSGGDQAKLFKKVVETFVQASEAHRS